MEPDTHVCWPIKERTVLGSGAVSSFVNEVVETPAGSVMNRQFMTHPGAVAIVAWDELRDEIATVRQYRHPVRMELTEVPAGLLDVRGEDYLSAAKRELAEEVRLKASTWNVLVDIFSTPGGCEETLRIYLARDLSSAPLPDGFDPKDEEAVMTHQFIPRAELVDAVLAGKLGSPSLVSGIMALETVRLSGRIGELRGQDAPWEARRLK